jgi:DNA-binding GntR family transcriptional regulator
MARADDRQLATLAEAVPKRVGAAELIANTLRDQILAGNLRPGDALPEVEVAAAFSVARNTVREALKILARSGLAFHEVHHGVSVRRLTAEDVNQLYGLRTILEGAGCDRAGHLAPSEIDHLFAPVQQGEAALAADDIWGTTIANQMFHRAIVSLIGNPRVEAVHNELLGELTLGLMLEERNEETAAMWLRENRKLVDLFVAGPARKARVALQAYLDASRANLLAYVEQ